MILERRITISFFYSTTSSSCLSSSSPSFIDLPSLSLYENVSHRRTCKVVVVAVLVFATIIIIFANMEIP